MLLEKIDADLKSSMKEKNTLKVSVLRLVKSAVQNKAIEKKTESLSDDVVLDIIQRQVKQRRDSIEEFKKGNRQDLVDQESKEIDILKTYLPEQLSEADLKGIIQKAIETTGAKSKADMGKVMKEALVAAKGRADGKRVSQLVSSLLQ